MKRLVFILVILCLCFSGVVSAKNDCKYKQGDLELIDGNAVEKSTGEPANGLLCTYGEDDNLEREYPYKNGKLEGIGKSYHKNGKLGAEYPYKKGKLEGVVKYYGENFIEETPYKNDKREGISKTYYESGILFAKVHYYNDKPVGGMCANGRTFTNAELLNWGNGHTVRCD